MTSNKIVHICPDDGNYIPEFIDFVQNNFEDHEKHSFFICNFKGKYYGSPKKPNTFAAFQLGQHVFYWKLLRQMHHADKLIIHGLFGIKTTIMLTLQPWLLPKCYWIIWGGDLYAYRHRKNTLFARTKEFFRRFVIKRVGHLVSGVEGDVELAREWYGARGHWHNCMPYLSGMITGCDSLPKTENTIHILVGNSADPSNEHFEILEMLKQYADEDIHIHVPLSYGPQNYAKRVVQEGKRIFGNKFTPIIDWLPRDEYRAFLATVDLAIFNHRRQQALGNAIILLELGKAVFMRSDISSWAFFRRFGLHVFDINAFDINNIPRNLSDNKRIVREYFSDDALRDQLFTLFN